jgi:hypothetical protein
MRTTIWTNRPRRELEQISCYFPSIYEIQLTSINLFYKNGYYSALA